MTMYPIPVFKFRVVRDSATRVPYNVIDSPEKAARIRDDAAKKIHGEFAVLNFPM